MSHNDVENTGGSGVGRFAVISWFPTVYGNNEKGSVVPLHGVGAAGSNGEGNRSPVMC